MKNGGKYSSPLAVPAGAMAWAWPHAALAQGTLPAFGSAGFYISLVILIGAALIAGWALYARSLIKARAVRTALASQMRQHILDTAQSGHILILPDGSCHGSERVLSWLQCYDRCDNLDALRRIFLEYGAKEKFVDPLIETMSNLAESPEDFEDRLYLPGPDMLLQLRGRSILDPRGGQRMGLVWVNDASDIGQEWRESAARLPDMKTDIVLLRQTLEALPVPAWSRDRRGRLIYVNSAYTRLAEAADAQEVIDTQLELASDDGSPSMQDLAAWVRKSGQPETVDMSIVSRGERRQIRLQEMPPSGKKDISVGFALDLTDFHALKSELASHIRNHAETLDMLSTPVAIFGTDQGLNYYNSAFARLWKLPEEWLDTKPSHGELLERLRERRKLPEQADFPAWKAQILDQYTEALQSTEEMWYLPDGQTLRVVTQPHPEGGLLILFEDVTDRLALERSYNTLIAVQQETLDNLHEAVALIGSDGLLKLYNINFQQFWDLDTAFLDSGPHISEILDRLQPSLSKTQDEWPGIRSEILAMILDRQQKIERRALRDGRITEATVVPLPDGNTLVSFLNVTDSVRVEQALRDRNEALEAADRLKTQFISSMSYELRTPLNTIIGFVEILIYEYFGKLNERQKDYAGAILEAASILRDLVDTILDLAVIEAGKLDLETETFAVRDAMQQVAGMARDAHASKATRITVRCNRETGDICADKLRLQQAVYSLLTEAINTVPNGSTISLLADGTEDEVRIRLRDSSKRKTRTKAQQTDMHEKQEEMGSMALTLIRRFFELHGGSVKAPAQIRSGFEVTCRIPRIPDGPEKGPGKSEPALPGTQSGTKAAKTGA